MSAPNSPATRRCSSSSRPGRRTVFDPETPSSVKQVGSGHPRRAASSFTSERWAAIETESSFAIERRRYAAVGLVTAGPLAPAR